MCTDGRGENKNRALSDFRKNDKDRTLTKIVIFLPAVRACLLLLFLLYFFVCARVIDTRMITFLLIFYIW